MRKEIILPGCKPIAKYEDLTEEQWHELRRTGIGGSDVGGIMGYSKYSSPLSVWMEKTGRMHTDAEGEAIDVGNILEGFIRDDMFPDYIGKYFPETDCKIIPPAHMYRSNNYPFMIINPDGFIEIDGKLIGLEIKTGSSYVLKEWGGKDGDDVPDSYYCQVQHYLAGTGLDAWWIFGLIGNQRVLRTVPRNELFIETMIRSEAEFWELVEINNPLHAPLPTGTDADMQALFELGDPQQESTVDLSGCEYLIDRYEQLRVELQDRKEEREIIKQKIIFLLGDSKYGESDLFKVTFSRFKRTNFDTKGFKKDYPDLFEQYKSESETGRLSVKERKE